MAIGGRVRSMPLLSRSQIDQLGRRLRGSDPTVEDLELLERVRSLYEDPLTEVIGVLVDLGLEPGSRPKTTGTTIEKLRRMPDLRLSEMQDLAGARVVAEMTRGEQDLLVEQIRGRFDASKVKGIWPTFRDGNGAGFVGSMAVAAGMVAGLGAWHHAGPWPSTPSVLPASPRGWWSSCHAARSCGVRRQRPTGGWRCSTTGWMRRWRPWTGSGWRLRSSFASGRAMTSTCTG